MMKKIAALVLALMLPLCAAVAEEATALPFGVGFSMDYQQVLDAAGKDAEQDNWGDDTGVVMLGACDIGIGGLKAESVNFQIDRNNSASASRLSQIYMELDAGDNCIAGFRAALAALTAQYGAPDGDPFDEFGVESYVEFGNLNASWTKPDVRINLSMGRMYMDSLSLDFANRLCYDANDLKAE